jgi:hypothetical protein
MQNNEAAIKTRVDLILFTATPPRRNSVPCADCDSTRNDRQYYESTRTPPNASCTGAALLRPSLPGLPQHQASVCPNVPSHLPNNRRTSILSWRLRGRNSGFVPPVLAYGRPVCSSPVSRLSSSILHGEERESPQSALSPNRSEYRRAYQLSRKPNSIVLLPPSNANLLRNVGDVTKIYPAFKGLAFCVESIVPLLVGNPMLGLRWLNVL